MCGIAGILGQSDSRESVRRMVQAMHHRGPDDNGISSIATRHLSLTLGSARLAIVDLSPAGHMPMHDPDTGNCVVFNGEIYNFREIRRELEALGEQFRSATDTEVILKAYKQWGRNSVHRFRGMFAFALWDERANELWLARDPLGKKPLYYYRGAQGAFLFASEVRALLAAGLVGRRLDPSALQSFLFNGFVVSPGTIVAGVRSLMPGHSMRVTGDGQVHAPVAYWRPGQRRHSAHGRRPEELLDESRGILEQAVRLRLMSDVPLGVFLSGGLDSSAIVAVLARMGMDVRTFSVTFSERRYDESPFSQWVSRKFATRHTELHLSREDFQPWLTEGVTAMDQPSFDGLNTFIVCRAARQTGLTVALSGIGADELFGGYPFFRSLPYLRRLRRWMSCVPSGIGRRIAAFSFGKDPHVSGPWKLLELLEPSVGPAKTEGICGYQTAQMLFPKYVRQHLLESADTLAYGLPEEFLSFLARDAPDEALEISASSLAMRLFLGERVLRDSDSMSMAVSLELRAPFTDTELIDTLWQVPESVRCANPPDKPFERALVAPYLGAEYPIRPKQGFVLPFREWLGEPATTSLLRATLSNRALCTACGLRPEAVGHVAASFFRAGIPWSRLWSLFVLLAWCDRHHVSL